MRTDFVTSLQPFAHFVFGHQWFLGFRCVPLIRTPHQIMHNELNCAKIVPLQDGRCVFEDVAKAVIE
jgi:hypothetical protein